MINLKKWLVGLLVCSCVVSLCACGSKDKNSASDSVSSEQTQSADNSKDNQNSVASEPNSSNGNAQNNVDETESTNNLTAIFDDINANYNLGTAGSSIRAAEKEIKLLDWASTTNMSEQSIKTATSNYINKLDNETKAEFVKKLSYMDYYRSGLLSGEPEVSVGDLEANSSHYPWNNDTVKMPLDAIMQAAGA